MEPVCVDIKDFAKYILYICMAQNIRVTPVKLQKLLYYAQSWHMVFFERHNTLFADVPEAWVNGPVYPVIYQEYKQYDTFNYFTFESIGITEEEVCSSITPLEEKMKLCTDQIAYVKKLISEYGKFNHDQLILMTHLEKPWREAREGLDDYERSNKKINLDTMHTYYKARIDKQ